jgi:hypothetical protein
MEYGPIPGQTLAQCGEFATNHVRSTCRFNDIEGPVENVVKPDGCVRQVLSRSNSAASARVIGRPRRKPSESSSSTAWRAAAKERSIRVAR